MYYKEIVLVTGGNGFIGTNLIKELTEKKYKVYSLSKSNPDKKIKSVSYIACDIRETKKLTSYLENISPNIIVHLAGSKSKDNSFETYYQSIDINLIGTLNILNASLKLNNLKKIIIIGTGEEYGNNAIPFKEDQAVYPIGPYSLSKIYQSMLAKSIFRTHGLPITTIRASVCYGPNQDQSMLIPAMFYSLINNYPFKITAGAQTRDFIYIDDLVNAIIKIVNCKDSKIFGQTYNIGSGNAIKIKDVAKIIAKFTGNEDNILFGTLEYRQNEQMEYLMDIKKAKRDLDWEPHIMLEEGIKKTYEHLKG
jgi:UDP-glucose 4-epimerase